MAQFDKTFPTLDCAACILTPKMVNVGQNNNIELFTYSEVEEVSGYIGNFEVKIKQKPRYVSEEKCTGCGECENVCPVKTKSEFDLGLKDRSAIYRAFPQAVPNTYIIDIEVCKHCNKCKKVCEANAIEYEMEEEIKEIEVGNIIVSTGFDVFDASKAKPFGYGKYPNVYTSMEFERLSHASGPTGGKIVLRDGTIPKSVAIIHCVGSRDENYNEYCSRVCCMYSLKIAHLVRDKLDAEVYDLYIDMRSFGKRCQR